MIQTILIKGHVMANIGSLSSLGLGSNGVLNYDIIDKLKEADQKALIDPIKRKEELVSEKLKNLTKISTLTATLKSAVLDLASGAFYAKRTAEVSGDAVSIDVLDGVAPQEIEMTVNRLAKRDIWESKGFSDRSDPVTDVDTTMTIKSGGNEYDIDVTAGTTLDELRDLITEKTEGNVIASILDTGNAADPYVLVLKSKETGSDNAITVTYDDGDPDTDNDDFLNLANKQQAVNAEITFNGIDIERGNNKIDDLITGVTFELLKEEPGSVNHIKIKQDVEGIADEMADFVDSYNAWVGAMNDAVKYDPKKKTVGIFQDESAIKRLVGDVTSALFGTNKEGKGAATFGLSVNREGLISFDRDTFTAALRQNPDEVEKVFSDPDDGIFTKLNDTLRYATSSNGPLSLLEKELENQEKRLEDQKFQADKMLEDRYAVMAQRFMMYDNMIGQLNVAFQSLQNLINAQLNAKK